MDRADLAGSNYNYSIAGRTVGGITAVHIGSHIRYIYSYITIPYCFLILYVAIS